MQSDEPIERLVIRAQRGDVVAWTVLVQRFLRAAYAVALAIVGRPSDAEDVAQDAFVSALKQIRACREPQRFAGWLLQIVRNRALNWLDSRSHRDVARDPARIRDRAIAPSSMAGMQGALVDALTALPPTQREVVLLHDLEEWTHAEIADVLGCSEVMSRQHLFLARKTLRSALGGASHPEPKVTHG